MKRLELTLNTKKKTLGVNEDLIKLEDAFSNAFKEEDSSETLLVLKYKGELSKEDSPIDKEMDKLLTVCGEKLFEKINVSGNYFDEAHYLNFYGDFNAKII